MANTLNGHNLKGLYGVVISNSEAFLSLPKRKDSINHNWPEVNGMDIDLTNPTFEAREFQLKCALIADGRDDFHTKYDGFFTELSGQGVHELYLDDLDKTFKVFYKDQQNVTKLTQINRDKVGITFTLVFGETDPSINIDPVYLVDENDNFIIG